jgi:hypothetical protein
VIVALSTLVELLEKSKDDNEVLDLIHSLDKRAKIRRREDRHYCSLRKQGIELLFDDTTRLRAVFLHSDGHERFHAFESALPGDIRFGMERSEIHKKAGPPYKSGGGTVLFGDMVPHWDKYRFPTFFMHLTYSTELRLLLVGLEKSEIES